EWQRAQAFGLLAEGQAQVALNIFDQLLHESPADTLAWRGRGRALVRLAEAYQKINDHVKERLALADAVRADPSLSEDPQFQIWYQRLGEMEAREKTEQQRKMDFQEDIRKNPRTVKSYGLGFDLISAGGTLAVSGTLVVHRIFFPTLAVDLAGPGLDARITVAPFSSRWSPYL